MLRQTTQQLITALYPRPVSYTHLDVYKRQGLGGALCVWGGINLLEGYGQDNPGSNAYVS